MKKTLIAMLAVVTLLGFAGSSFALLCASDPVPAGTLLFPFLTGKYAATATASNPVADRTAPTALFAITNISASARIVHNVLYNDMSYPLLDWDVLLTGYDVITYNFADIMEGYLRATGPVVSPSGRAWSPVGGQPIAAGPVPSFWAGIPSLPYPQGTSSAAGTATNTPSTTTNTTTSIWGLCTNPTYTTPFTVNTDNQKNRLPEYNRIRIFNGLRKSQVMAENGWWGTYAPAYVAPEWLLNRSTNDNIWAYITSDVVDACGFGFPSQGSSYFGVFARPYTTAYYHNMAANAFWVDLGNTLIGDWFVVGTAGNIAEGNLAVHVEMDNQDVVNSVSYPKAILNGASFYRYSEVECNPTPQTDDTINCTDFYTGTGIGGDYTTGAEYFFGPRNLPLPTNDFREPLPSAFAFRWLIGGGFDGGTKLRVWKEYPDLLPYYGYTYVYAGLQYAYYAWDEEEHVVSVSGGCDVSPCPTQPGEINQLPLEVQEVDVNVLTLPKTYMNFGWALIAFLGSNTLGITIPNGYVAPSPNTYGTQAWVEVMYSAQGRYSVDFSAAVLGNYLCDGLAVTASPRNGIEETDLGDVLY